MAVAVAGGGLEGKEERRHVWYSHSATAKPSKNLNQAL